MNKRNRKTISDVANHLGIHKSTVSRALNNPDRISKGLSQKIKKAARELNYIPSKAAQSLLLKQTKTIALLLPSMTNTVFTDVITGVTSVTDQADYSLMIGNATYTELGEEELVESYIQQAVDGFILGSSCHSDRTVKLLKSTGAPVVEILDFAEEPIDTNIGVDQEQAAFDLTDYLISKGHTKIAFCSLELDRRAKLRKLGWQRALKTAGLDTSFSLEAKGPASLQKGGQLLDEAMTKFDEVDALFFVSDELAAGAVMECQRKELRVGKDIALCGFHDLEIASALCPSLTTIRTPRRIMGEMAARNIIDRLAGIENLKRFETLPYELQVRESA